KHGNAAGDGALHTQSRGFHTAPLHALLSREPFQQFAFAATQVKHLRARIHNFADDGVVAAAEQVAHETALLGRLRWHAAFSSVLERKPRTNSVCSATSTKNASWP